MLESLAMSDTHQDSRAELTRAARQLLAIEELLGGSYIPARPDELADVAIVTAAPTAAALPKMSLDEKAAVLAEMDETEVTGCTKCGLCKSRTNTVFGEGDADADLVFVGEGPGADEDASGRPFVGRAGELLDKMITAMGLSREQVFICNMVKCRPPGNRAPAPEEVQACWDYLIRQLQIIQPKVIVTLGNPATQGLLQIRTGITKLRGQFQQLPDIGAGLAGIAVMPTFHPAYILRQYTPDNRRKVWSDLKQVMGALGMADPAASG